jgi:hypothetical protein
VKAIIRLKRRWLCIGVSCLILENDAMRNKQDGYQQHEFVHNERFVVQKEPEIGSLTNHFNSHD